MQSAASSSRQASGCSTPFGITEGGIGCGSLCRGGFPMVLNAFRHHRGGHAGVLLVSRTIHRCSTPFGITEGGMKSIDGPGPGRGAQRLSASQRGA